MPAGQAGGLAAGGAADAERLLCGGERRVPPERIVELDWWEQHTLQHAALSVHAAPSEATAWWRAGAVRPPKGRPAEPAEAMLVPKAVPWPPDQQYMTGVG